MPSGLFETQTDAQEHVETAAWAVDTLIEIAGVLRLAAKGGDQIKNQQIDSVFLIIERELDDVKHELNQARKEIMRLDPPRELTENEVAAAFGEKVPA